MKTNVGRSRFHNLAHAKVRPTIFLKILPDSENANPET